jgi:hypothetical protein
MLQPPNIVSYEQLVCKPNHGNYVMMYYLPQLYNIIPKFGEERERKKRKKREEKKSRERGKRRK